MAQASENWAFLLVLVGIFGIAMLWHALNAFQNAAAGQEQARAAFVALAGFLALLWAYRGLRG